MKRFTFLTGLATFILFLSSAVNAGICSSEYMTDPCPVDGYSIVEIEEVVKGRHNQMDSIHNYNSIAILTGKRCKPDRYYIKRCRVVARYR